MEYDSTTIVVERPTKWVYSVRFLQKALVQDLAHIFINRTYIQHGRVEEVTSDQVYSTEYAISDQDKRFT